MEYIVPCLDSHDPLDFVIVSLGSNELKFEFGLSSSEIGENLRTFLALLTTHRSQCGAPRPVVYVVVPPLIDDETDYCRAHEKYKGAGAKSYDLKLTYEQIAEEENVRLVDVQDSLKTGADGVHLLPEAHRFLAERLTELISR